MQLGFDRRNRRILFENCYKKDLENSGSLCYNDNVKDLAFQTGDIEGFFQNLN